MSAARPAAAAAGAPGLAGDPFRRTRSRPLQRSCAGTIHSINISLRKGEPKTPVDEAEIVSGEGVRGDAHRGAGHRQVSLLMLESVEEQKRLAGGEAKARAAGIEIVPGVFAENLTTSGIDLTDIRIGDELIIGRRREPGGRGQVRLKVSQIGKDCRTPCAIYRLAGDCIMPRLGIFCEVVEGGTVRTGDRIERR